MSKISTIASELHYGVRALSKQPIFTLVAVATLALGIGAVTAIFSMVNRVILQPPPFRQPDQLVAAWDTYQPDRNAARVDPTTASRTE